MATHSAAPHGKQNQPQEDLQAVLERFEQWADGQENTGKANQKSHANSSHTNSGQRPEQRLEQESEVLSTVESSGRGIRIGKGFQKAAHVAYQASSQVVREISYEEALARTHAKTNFDWTDEDEDVLPVSSASTAPQTANTRPATASQAASTKIEEKTIHSAPPQTQEPQSQSAEAASASAEAEVKAKASSSKQKNKAQSAATVQNKTTGKLKAKPTEAKAAASAKNKKSTEAASKRKQASTKAATKAKTRANAKSSPREPLVEQASAPKTSANDGESSTKAEPEILARPAASKPDFQEVLASQLKGEQAQADSGFAPSSANKASHPDAPFPGATYPDAAFPNPSFSPSQEARPEGSVSVTVHLSATERSALRQRATQLGLTPDAYLRQCALELESLRGELQEMLVVRMQTTHQLPAQASPARLNWFARIKQRFFSRTSQASAQLPAPQSYSPQSYPSQTHRG